MLNIKQIVSRKEENRVYSSKRGLMEHVKRRKIGVYYIAPRFESYYTHFLAASHVMHASWQTLILSTKSDFTNSWVKRDTFFYFVALEVVN